MRQQRPRRGGARTRSTTVPSVVVLALVTVGASVLSACGSSNTLHLYDFRDGALAVVSELPPSPRVLSGPWFVGDRSGDPVRDMVRIGARVAREVETHELRERLDSAAALIDVGYVMEDETLERVARYLGARTVPDEADADFVLELIVVEYGIDAESWNAAARVFIEADATLLERASGTEIWRAEIGACELLGPAVFGPARAVRDVVTAATLADLDVDDLVLALEHVADFGAEAISDRLRRDLREARRSGDPGGL